ncbi:MAG: DEAD/DEAH box helicase family protein [Chitinophagaceae bacterium]|nr:DEAD/DEAH box helicase family protein [Chitinophagaceae bacterium]
MLHYIIQQKKNEWLQSDDCTIRDLVKYIRDKGHLRDTQIEAIETYLFLKIQGQNKPLWQLFSEGFFTNGTDLAKLDINQIAREYLTQNKNAFALFDFARQKNGNGTYIPELEKLIKANPASLDYDTIIKSIFYNVNYADYLMSLPMGAGKTFLMAAFIYLDLYFADNEPENKAFAHNFLVLIPSGLKSSIVPSLKTIENFDPSWVLPEPSASNLKKLLKFEVLDEQKTAKKSNKARNPNAQKVNACLPNPFGQVFVVNAEKVILESFKFNAQTELELDEEEKDTTNDLKRLFGQIPNLSILIDEVHHAATDDIKLRQAVNYWHSKGNITTVLGFSGTPYLQSAEKIKADDYEFKFSQITNTVYYYPLVTAIRKFLKTPTVKIGQNLDRFQIIKQGIEDFDNQYKNKVYENGTIAKVAIYCSNIEVLEEEVYPFLTGELKINPNEILRFHKGNKAHPQPEGSELEFRSLDLPISKKRYILLVQVGKEGWDCPSLTGVILSQKGDSPQNMVLQTSCRCLRQVDKDKEETALIWLNKDNADTLNKQLKQEQNTSIEELNSTKRTGKPETIDRHSRMDFLQLPKVDFYQMKVTYQAIDEEETPNTKAKLKALLKNIHNFKASALITTSDIANIDTGEIDVINETGIAFANFNQWLFEISRESFGLISEELLHQYDSELNEIFETVSYEKNGQHFFNELYDLHTIQSKIRLAFSIKRDLQTDTEVIPKQAELLIAERLTEVEKNARLYPNEADTLKILELDKSNASVSIDTAEIEKAYQLVKNTLEQQGLGNMVPTYESFKADKDYSLPVKSKNHSFHYLPYNFGGSGSSGFEIETLQKALQLADFKNKELEIYYNGERGLTEFVINCFAKEGRYWKNVGKYTTDFLVVKRTAKDKIHKALLIETKGSVYAEDKVFQKKKNYVETEFLKLNKEKFGYQRFDFLYLEDSKDIAANITKLNNKINQFFND